MIFLIAIVLYITFVCFVQAMPCVTAIVASFYGYKATKEAHRARNASLEPYERKAATKNYEEYKIGAYIFGGISLMFALGPAFSLLFQRLSILALYRLLGEG